MAKSMAPKANSSTPSNTFLRAIPVRKPVANSNPDPTLKLNFIHCGACLSSNSRIPSIYPTQAHRYSFGRNPSLRRGGTIGGEQCTCEERFEGLLELAQDVLPSPEGSHHLDGLYRGFGRPRASAPASHCSEARER